MSQKKVLCPHCGKANTYTEPSWDEALEEALPENLILATGVTVVRAVTGPLGGLIAGGLLLARNVVRYADGVSMTCAGCGRKFKV